MKKRLNLWIMAAVLLAVCTVAFFTYRQFSRRVTSVLDVEPVFSGSTEDFLNTFQEKADEADKRYRDGVVELEGRFLQMDVRDTAAYAEFGRGSYVLQATFNADGTADLQGNPSWKKDSLLFFRCYYYGYLPAEDLLGEKIAGSVQMGRCRLVQNRDAK